MQLIIRARYERQNESTENDQINESRMLKVPCLMNIGDDNFWHYVSML